MNKGLSGSCFFTKKGERDMIELEPLWTYQKADMALSRFENGLKKSPVRNKLLSVRNGMVEQQNRAKKWEADLRAAHEDCARIEGEISSVQAQVQNFAKEVESCDTEDLRQLRIVIRAMEECNKTLEAMTRELQAAKKLADSAEATVRDIRGKLAAGKKEFDALKAQHDAELKEASPELERLRAEAKRLMAQVDPQLLERYQKIKKTRMNPVAKVANEQCSGCNMALPSLMMRRLRAGEQVVECENCGRILYYTEG